MVAVFFSRHLAISQGTQVFWVSNGTWESLKPRTGGGWLLASKYCLTWLYSFCWNWEKAKIFYLLNYFLPLPGKTVSREMEPGILCWSLSSRCSDFTAPGLSSHSHGIHFQPAEVFIPEVSFSYPNCSAPAYVHRCFWFWKSWLLNSVLIRHPHECVRAMNVLFMQWRCLPEYALSLLVSTWSVWCDWNR